VSNKFRNKYRVDSARLKNWNYGLNAIYFVTVCTANRDCFFGSVVNGEMNLSEMGEIAKQTWAEIPEHFPFVILDSHVVMPNHIHGIIAIQKPDAPARRDAIYRVSNQPNETNPDAINTDAINTDAINTDAIETDAINRVSTGVRVGGITGNHNPMLHQNLSRIIRWYKGRVTFLARKVHADFGWQTRFHDHIIRNQLSMDRINSYIHNNPALWADDMFFVQTDVP